MDSLDQNKLLRTMIERWHADASPEELKEYIQGYLKGGIQEISGEIEQHNHFNYQNTWTIIKTDLEHPRDKIKPFHYAELPFRAYSYQTFVYFTEYVVRAIRWLIFAHLSLLILPLFTPVLAGL